MGKAKRVHNADTRPATLVMDGELENLKAQAEGSKPFTRSGLWDRLAALELKDFWKLPARERLGVGYYTAAQRRAESMKGSA